MAKVKTERGRIMGGITLLNLAIYKKNDEAYGAGWELCHRVPAENERGYDDDVYYIGSMYLPRADFASKNEVIFHALAEAVTHVDDGDTLIIVYSTEEMFYQHKRLYRKVGPVAGGRKLLFKKVGKIRRWAVMLAIDAVKRKSTIIMPIET